MYSQHLNTKSKNERRRERLIRSKSIDRKNKILLKSSKSNRHASSDGSLVRSSSNNNVSSISRQRSSTAEIRWVSNKTKSRSRSRQRNLKQRKEKANSTLLERVKLPPFTLSTKSTPSSPGKFSSSGSSSPRNLSRLRKSAENSPRNKNRHSGPATPRNTFRFEEEKKAIKEQTTPRRHSGDDAKNKIVHGEAKKIRRKKRRVKKSSSRNNVTDWGVPLNSFHSENNILKQIKKAKEQQDILNKKSDKDIRGHRRNVSVDFHLNDELDTTERYEASESNSFSFNPSASNSFSMEDEPCSASHVIRRRKNTTEAKFSISKCSAKGYIDLKSKATDYIKKNTIVIYREPAMTWTGKNTVDSINSTNKEKKEQSLNFTTQLCDELTFTEFKILCGDPSYNKYIKKKMMEEWANLDNLEYNSLGEEISWSQDRINKELFNNVKTYIYKLLKLEKSNDNDVVIMKCIYTLFQKRIPIYTLQGGEKGYALFGHEFCRLKFSCTPNCVMVVNTDEQSRYVSVITTKNFRKGEEMTVCPIRHYGSNLQKKREWRRLYSAKCTCEVCNECPCNEQTALFCCVNYGMQYTFQNLELNRIFNTKPFEEYVKYLENELKMHKDECWCRLCVYGHCSLAFYYKEHKNDQMKAVEHYRRALFVLTFKKSISIYTYIPYIRSIYQCYLNVVNVKYMDKTMDLLDLEKVCMDEEISMEEIEKNVRLLFKNEDHMKDYVPPAADDVKKDRSKFLIENLDKYNYFVPFDEFT